MLLATTTTKRFRRRRRSRDDDRNARRLSSSFGEATFGEAEKKKKRLYEPPEPLPSGPIVSLERSVNAAVVSLAVAGIDRLFAGRDYPRFYALETIARVPYFSFLSVLHMYESFGWWRRADYLKVHFAETMNEYHHLLIMEAMGGSERYADRVFAQHVALIYFWVAVGMFFVSPRMAYNLMEQIEEHAYATYDEFLKREGETLKTQPACGVAVSYYQMGDLYLFDEFQTNVYEGLKEGKEGEGVRRPKIRNMYDVIENVRNDELEHVKTMSYCQRPGNLLRANSTLRGEMKAREMCGGEYNDDVQHEFDEEEECAILDDGQELKGEKSCEGALDCVVKKLADSSSTSSSFDDN